MKQLEKRRRASSSTAQKAQKKKTSLRIIKHSNGHVIELGKYVVSDPTICHGYLTFKWKGTQAIARWMSASQIGIHFFDSRTGSEKHLSWTP